MDISTEKEKYQLVLGNLEDELLDQELPIITNLSQRHEHFYIVGRGGRGKSSLMERMALYDLIKGLSIIFIDPKGNSSRRLFYNAKDKTKIRYLSINHPMRLNPLRKKSTLKNIIDEYIGINDVFTTQTASNVESTTLMREILSNTIKIFKEKDRDTKTICQFLMLEKHRDIRRRYKFPSQELHDYWHEFDKYDRNIRVNKEKIESAKRVASRLSLASDGMDDFLCGENELYIGEMIERGESLLIDLSGMSKETKIFIPILITQAISSYLQFERKSKNTLIVYADEFQRYTSKYFDDVLEMGRSEKVGFVLAHHDFSQVDRKSIDEILAVVNNFSVFNCSKQVADYMASVFGIDNRNFFDLKKFYCWTRLGTDNSYMSLYSPIPKEPEDFTPPSPVKHNFLNDSWFMLK